MAQVTIHLTKAQEEYIEALGNVTQAPRYRIVKGLIDLGCATADFIVDSREHLINELKKKNHTGNDLKD